jgi:transcriptional regulator with XRE-family HTH domain
MLTKTLQDGLQAYGIGAKIRALRLKKKMGLVELGRHTGLSPALLSKIERDRLFPTLPTLLRIALVFSVGLDYFFGGLRERPVAAIVRREDRLTFPEQPGKPSAYRFQSLDFPAVERPFNAYFAEFMPAPANRLKAHQHPGGEFLYVLAGTLALRFGDDEHQLREGDSIFFDSTVPHAYRRATAAACAAIVVTAG